MLDGLRFNRRVFVMILQYIDPNAICHHNCGVNACHRNGTQVSAAWSAANEKKRNEHLDDKYISTLLSTLIKKSYCSVFPWPASIVISTRTKQISSTQSDRNCNPAVPWPSPHSDHTLQVPTWSHPGTVGWADQAYGWCRWWFSDCDSVDSGGCASVAFPVLSWTRVSYARNTVHEIHNKHALSLLIWRIYGILTPTNTKSIVRVLNDEHTSAIVTSCQGNTFSQLSQLTQEKQQEAFAKADTSKSMPSGDCYHRLPSLHLPLTTPSLSLENKHTLDLPVLIPALSIRSPLHPHPHPAPSTSTRSYGDWKSICHSVGDEDVEKMIDVVKFLVSYHVSV